MILAARLKLDRLHNAAMLGFVAANIFHPERSLAAVSHFMVGKGSHAFIILKPPLFKMIAGDILEIAIPYWSRVVCQKDGRPAMRDKERVAGQHAFHIVGIVRASHDNGDQCQVVLQGGLLKLRRLLWRDIVGEGDSVVSIGGGPWEAGN